MPRAGPTGQRRSVEPLREHRTNHASRADDEARLNGRVYTPDALADEVVAGLVLRDGDRCLDPACGDGVWLAALARRAARDGLTLRLEGWDTDPAAVSAARARLGPAATIVARDGLAGDERFDVVVGNPPYLEAKRMPDAEKARVRALCPVAGVGAFDLYAAFVERSVRRLGPGGRLALVLPNRLLVTASTEGLRRWLLTEGAVEVEDRTAGRPFRASVYPIVLRFVRGGAGFRVAGVDRFDRTLLDGLPAWPCPADAAEGRWLVRALADAPERLGERFEARSTVSFHRAGLRDAFVSRERPASPHAARFVGGGRYEGNHELGDDGVLRWGGWWIDHDEARARAVHNPLPPRALFAAPKILVAQNARAPRAALDLDGFVLKDTFVLVRHRGGDAATLPALLAAIRGEAFARAYAALFAGTRKGGGYLAFLPRHLEAMPIALDPPPRGTTR